MTTPSSGPKPKPTSGGKQTRSTRKKASLAERQKAAAAAAAARARARRRRQLLTWGGVVAALVAALVVGIVVGTNSPDSATDESSDTTVTAGFPDSTRTDDAVVMVADDAQDPVSVELYVDLQCPACREYESRVADTLERLVIDGRVELLVHPIAILDGASTTRYSSRAAAAVACAADEGLFWQYQNLLYAEQPDEGGDGLSDERLVELGIEVGLSADFETCVADGAQADWVEQITEAAAEEGIRATPTVLVDGEQITGGSAEDLEAAVEAAE